MTAAAEVRRPAEPFLAWPGGANLRITLPLCLSFAKLFSSVYGSTSLLAALRNPHPDPFFHFELSLPFVPSMAALYLTVPLILLLTPFILRTWRDLTPFFLTLTVETLVAGLCFLLIPFAQAYPPRVASGFWGGLFRVADTLNLDYNEVPSLHVTFAVTAALVFGRRRGPLGRGLFAAWTVAVILSTLLMHEHHLLDVGAGVVLALAGFAAVQQPASREETLDKLRIEALSLREVVRAARRRPRLLLTAASLWMSCIPRWSATRLLRAAWSLALHAGDDGHGRGTGLPDRLRESALAAFVSAGLAEAGAAEALERQLAGLPEHRREEVRTTLCRIGAGTGCGPTPPAAWSPAWERGFETIPLSDQSRNRS